MTKKLTPQEKADRKADARAGDYADLDAAVIARAEAYIVAHAADARERLALAVVARSATRKKG